MFKFDFLREKNEATDTDTVKPKCNWIPALKVEVSISQIEKDYEPADYAEDLISTGCKLKLMRSEKALHDLKQESCATIIEAEAKHSDLIPGKYEGGLKIWECSYDLGQYILEKDINLENKLVLDLGCGAGIIGLIALLKNSTVHFQDYNVEVLESVTIPNVSLNFNDRESVFQRCEFFSGDWESFAELKNSKDGSEPARYDLIFTSETIYNPDNHRKLYEVFKQRLKPDGVGFIAGKSYYFGVGGGMRQFQSLIEEDGMFDVEVVWKTGEGLQREILRILRKEATST